MTLVPPGTPGSTAPTAGSSSADGHRRVLAQIDVACRFPVILLFSGALLWLAVGTALALVSFVELHAGEVLANCAWLAYGRVRPAAWNSVIYGFASQAGLGVALWIICRLGRVSLVGAAASGTAALFWNLGVCVGVIGILAGYSTGLEGLEMPGYVGPILFLAYLPIAVGALVTFHARQERGLYVSHWFLLAGLFWFPWIYSTAHLLLVCKPVRGAAQIVINGWFLNNLRELWLTPLGLAAVFYFLPKLVQRPLHSRYLAMFTFWLLVLSGSWGGLSIGLPLPRWITALSTAASLGMLLPVLAVAVNCYRTWRAGACAKPCSPALSFILGGTASYVLAGFLRAADAFAPVHDITRLTCFAEAYGLLTSFGFVTMVFAGAIYLVLPRLTRQGWAAPALVKAHWLLTIFGLALGTLALAVGGVLQGLALNDPAVAFDQVSRTTAPFLRAASLAVLLLALGHVAFLYNLSWTLIRWLRCAVPMRALLVAESEPATGGVNS